jgi:uncharacterized short protein YbdD (DUF466 family)
MWRRDMRRGIESGQAVGRSGGPWSRFTRILRRVIGAPDYHAYLEHCQATGHAPTLGEREYVAQFFESKGKGVRCC